MLLDDFSANNRYMMCGGMVDDHVDLEGLYTSRRAVCVNYCLHMSAAQLLIA